MLNLRLKKSAEWEFRRLCGLILDEVMKQTPEVFQDIYEHQTS